MGARSHSWAHLGEYPAQGWASEVEIELRRGAADDGHLSGSTLADPGLTDAADSRGFYPTTPQTEHSPRFTET